MKFNLVAATAVFALLGFVEVDAQCAERKSWTQLSQGEKNAYLNAIKALKAKPASATRDYNRPQDLNYDDIVRLHWDYLRVSHGTPQFFPWHRKFMWTFERALQSVAPGVNVVYWSWQLDSERPESADVFSPNYFGTDGTGPSHCLTNGVTQGWNVIVPGPDRRKAPSNCVTRCMQLRSWWDEVAVNTLVEQNPRYDTFRQTFESTPHAHIHNQVGGACDMSTMYSPNDPLFFLHHANVDKQWAKFQDHCPSKKTDYGGSGGASVNDIMTPWGAAVSTVLDTRTMPNCYYYSKDQSDGPLNLAVCPDNPIVNLDPNSPNATVTTAPGSVASATPTILADSEKGWFNFALESLVGQFKGEFNTTTPSGTAGANKKVTGSSPSPRPAASNGRARRALELDLDLDLDLGLGEEPTATTSKYRKLSVPTTGPLVDIDLPTAPAVEVGTETESASATTTESASATETESATETDPFFPEGPIYTARPLPTTYIPAPTRLVTPPPANDRKDKVHLRQPPPLDENWLKSMRYDPKFVRKVENWHKYLVDDLNDRGYVSRSALKYFKENAPENAKKYGEDLYDRVEELPEDINQFYTVVVTKNVTIKKNGKVIDHKSGSTTLPVVVAGAKETVGDAVAEEETIVEAVETSSPAAGKGNYAKPTGVEYETPLATPTVPAAGYAKAPKGKCH